MIFKKWIARGAILFTAIVWSLLRCMALPALGAAVPAPDMERTGSVTVALRAADTDEVITDGTITLYQAADLRLQDGDMVYTYTDLFAGCPVLPQQGDEPTDGSWSGLARGLADWLAQEGAAAPDRDSGPVIQEEIDAQGKVVFPDLPLGLYLVVQTGSSTGYYDIEPFLVTVPLYDGGTWVYDVDASPKIEPSLSRVPTETPEATVPPESTSPAPVPGSVAETTEPSASPSAEGYKEKLPQTGLILWPIPVLGLIGIGLVIAGLVLRKP